MAYSISIIDHIRTILNNLQIASQLYFGPGIETDKKSEFWHGTIWQESPLFGITSITVNRKMYYTGTSIIFKSDINNEKISFGRIRAIVYNEDKEILIKVEIYLEFHELPQTLQKKKIFLNNILWLYENQFIFILPKNLVTSQEILFDDNDEYINNQNNYIIKEILYKKPGTEATWITRHIKFRHFLPLEYIQEPKNFKNLPVKKIFLDLYFDDFGTYRTVYHFLGDVYIQVGNMPFDLRKLLKNHFIIGFVPFGASFNELINTGNDLCGIKRHSANHGCRNCFVLREQLFDKNYDCLQNARYLHQIKKLRQQSNLLKSIQEKKDFATKYRISIQPSPFSYLKFNPFQQIPQDAYHAVSGKIARLMEITMDLLSESGKKLFIKNWKYFEFPSTWSKMPSPTSYSRSHFMIVPKKIIEVWSKMAICTKTIFSLSFLNDDYKKLEILLQEEHDLLIKIFPKFKNLSNMHINFHLIQHALSYANLINISVGIKEMVHRTFKNFAPHTNKKEIDFDLIKRYITIEGIRNFFDNNPNYKNFNLFNNWYITSGLNISEDSLTISVYSKYKGFSTAKKKEIQNFNLNNISIHLLHAYTNQLKKEGLLINKKIKFYNSIYYEVKNENGAINKIKIKSGDMIETL
ncbi:hypothetical protein Glove_193g43 [Diversispora epigaea]|uniref:Uncharacterized protein n=1 Tax=Diversispora epigaea TaxID=1348612 RepID=A0A397IV11_9GLOM|nr:hypothetical protein Glove_193g43 [Diversispora epigaea]